MADPHDRPVRNRTIFTTMELCLNKQAGPHGSVELIVSNPKYEQPVFYFWPLDIDRNLLADQLTDLCGVVSREVSDTVWTRMAVQEQLPGLAGT